MKISKKFEYLVGILTFSTSNKVICTFLAKYIAITNKKGMCTTKASMCSSNAALANSFLLMIFIYLIIDRALAMIYDF